MQVDVRNAGSIPGSRRSPREGHGNPLQYSCLENSMDRGAWYAVVQRVTQSQTQLKWLSMWAHTSRWCYLIISSATFFSSFLQSFPASGSFPVSWLFASGSQSIRPSASASVLSMNIQRLVWSPCCLISLLSLSLLESTGQVFCRCPFVVFIECSSRFD